MSKPYSKYLNHFDGDDNHQAHGDNSQNNIPKKDSHHHHHDHSVRDINSNLLLWCMIFTAGFSIVEAVVGYITHSIALQSDALHMLTDAVGLLIAYAANIISKKPATVMLTFGYGKAEALGALTNCVFTLILTAVLFIEIIYRFFKPVEIAGAGVFITASIGLVVNLIIAYMLHRHTSSLNIKAAFIHVMGDLLGSIIAIIAGAIIYFTHYSLIDPILSVGVVIILLISNYNIIKKSIVVLMAGVPEHLDYDEIGRDLNNIDGVIAVHDLHIWYMSANKSSLSAHIVANDQQGWSDTLDKCQNMLMEKHHIEHVTLQYEVCSNLHEHCNTL